MGLDDLINKGKELFTQKKDKIDNALHSEQAEEISDKVLDAGVNLAKKVAPDQFDSTVDDVRGNIDKAVGNE